MLKLKKISSNLTTRTYLSLDIDQW